MLAAASSERRGAYETIATPDEVPLYDLVPVKGPQGEVLDGYRGVQRQDTKGVVSIVSSRYGLVQHRAVARAVHLVGEVLAKDEKPSEVPFPREQIKLYAGGRRMAHSLVVPRKFTLGPGEQFYPGIRVFNSLDGSWAVRVEGFALRLCCTNQLYAGMTSVAELRELHLSSATDMLGMIQAAIHQILGRFDRALDVYAHSMNEGIRVVDVGPALVARGLPARHADAVQDRLPKLFDTPLWSEIPRWDAYQATTDYLSHEVTVSPDRERMFERAAAGALLAP